MKKIIKTKKHGESFPHKELWQCANTLYEHGRKVKKGGLYFDMATILMAYFTYEAYINVVGKRLDPKAWENEKDFFNKKKYFGIDGKLKRIKEICGNFEVNKGKEPYQTIKNIGKFRNAVVHAKTNEYEKNIEHYINDDPDPWPDDCFSCINKTYAKKVLLNTESFIKYLHENIKPYLNDDGIFFKDDALTGIIDYAESLTF